MKPHERTARLRLAARISHQRRITCNISEQVLAHRARLTVQKVLDIEDAKCDVDVATLRVIAHSLQTTPEELIRPACTYVRVEQE